MRFIAGINDNLRFKVKEENFRYFQCSEYIYSKINRSCSLTFFRMYRNKHLWRTGSLHYTNDADSSGHTLSVPGNVSYHLQTIKLIPFSQQIYRVLNTINVISRHIENGAMYHRQFGSGTHELKSFLFKRSQVISYILNISFPVNQIHPENHDYHQNMLYKIYKQISNMLPNDWK